MEVKSDTTFPAPAQTQHPAPLSSSSSSSSSSSHKPPHNTGRRKQAKPQKKPGKPSSLVLVLLVSR